MICKIVITRYKMLKFNIHISCLYGLIPFPLYLFSRLTKNNIAMNLYLNHNTYKITSHCIHLDRNMVLVLEISLLRYLRIRCEIYIVFTVSSFSTVRMISFVIKYGLEQANIYYLLLWHSNSMGCTASF